MNVAGPVEATFEMNSKRVPGTEVLKRSYAIQRKSAAENENLFRRTSFYCVHGLERGCARDVKGTKIEAAVEVASEGWSAIRLRNEDGPTEHGSGTWSKLTVV
jgi:hypothetical protein